MLDLLISSIRLPEQNLSDAEIKSKYGSIKQYDLLNARYWAQFFNRLNTVPSNKTTVGRGGSEMNEIIENFTFFHGVQQNTEFAYLQQIMTGGKLRDAQTPFMPGQEMRGIALFLQGVFLGISSNANPQVKIINEDIKNEIVQNLKLVEVQRVFEKQLAELEKIDNIKFVAPADPKKTTDEVVKSLYNRVSTNLQVDFMKILNFVQENSMTPFDYVRAFTNAIVGRRAVLHVSKDGTFEILPPESYRSVSAKDDDFGKYDIARMYYERMHKDDVIRFYGPDGSVNNNLTAEEVDQIKNELFFANENYQGYQAFFNYPLYSANDQFMSVLTVYYFTTLDTRLKTGKDADGNKKVYRVKKKEKGKPVRVLKKVKIAANMFVLESDIVKVVENPYKKGNLIFPLMHVQPNTYYGYNQCLFDSLKNTQKELDSIRYRVRENYTMDLGVILAFNGAKFRDGITPTEIYEELKATRITVSTTTGNAEDAVDRMPIIEMQNASLMKDIQEYLSLLNSMKATISEISNINSLVMGTPTEYVSYKTQVNSSQLATNSIQTIMDSVLQLFADAAFLSVEYIKELIISEPDNPLWQNLLGEEGVNRMLDLKDKTFASFLLSITRKSIIDPQRKQRIMAALDNLMNTGKIDFEDWLNSENATIMSELQDVAKYSVDKKRRQEEIMAKFQAEMQQNNAVIAADATVQKQVIDTQGANQRNSKDNISNIVNTMMREGKSEEQIAEFLQGLGGGVEQSMPQQGAPQQQMPQEQQMPPEMMQ